MILSYFNTILYFFNVYEQTPCSFICQIGKGVGLVWFIFSFVYTGLLIWPFQQSHNPDLSYYLKSSLLLPLCFRFFVWLIKLECTLVYLTIRTVSGNHMYVILRRLKKGPWSPKLLVGPKLEEGPDLNWGTPDLSPYHGISSIWTISN